MIAVACLVSEACRGPRPGPCRRRDRRPRPCPAAEAGAAGPSSAPRRLGKALDGFLGDGVPAPAAVRVADAARGFAAGNGYHTGAMVDRFL